MYAGIVGFKDGNLDAFIFEITLALGEVERGVVRSGVPVWHQLCFTTSPALRVNRPVSQEGNLVSRHIGLSREKLRKSVRQEARGGRESRKQLVLSLELSRSSLNGMISEQARRQTTPSVRRVLVSPGRWDGSETSLNTRHACFRLRKYLSIS